MRSLVNQTKISPSIKENVIRLLTLIKTNLIIWFLKGILNDKDDIRKAILLWKIKRIAESKEVKPMLDNLKTWLAGKKTYVIAIVGVVVNGLFAMGYIDE